MQYRQRLNDVGGKVSANIIQKLAHLIRARDRIMIAVYPNSQYTRNACFMDPIQWCVRGGGLTLRGIGHPVRHTAPIIKCINIQKSCNFDASIGKCYNKYA